MPAPPKLEELDQFGKDFRDARKAQDLSQDDLAAKLGVSQSVVSDIELGRKTEMNASLIVRIEEILGLDAGVVARASARRVALAALRSPPDEASLDEALTTP